MASAAVSQAFAIPAPRRWPPRASAGGADLSTPAVLKIFVACTLATYLMPLVDPNPLGRAAAVRQLLLVSAMAALLWVGVVSLLGWSRAAGLGGGSLSAWGVVPLVLFGAAALLTGGLRETASTDPGLLGLLVVGLVGAAFGEELAFRGFLLHGLTRRLGGPAAVLVGSVLFSVYHVPSLVLQDTPAGELAIVLVFHVGFGVFMCRIRAETGSLWFATAVHTLWNVVTVGAIVSSFDGDGPVALGLLKIALSGTGIVLAFRLARRGAAERPPIPPPPMPAPPGGAATALPPPPPAG
jgi:membrane protease YdiL (CAAX protease family)